MEEKLVKVLLDQYKEKGIDMYALLDDKFFKDLNLQTKVDLIKKYASHISSGTSRTLTKKDIRALIFDAGFSGVLTGVTAGLAARSAHRFFSKGMTPVGVIAGAVALGAAVSAGNTYLGSRKLMKNRDDILKKIDATASNPTDENALKVLTTRNTQLNPAVSASISSNSARHISDAASNIPAMILDQVEPVVSHMAMMHNYNKNYSEYADGVTRDEFFDAVEKSRSNMHSSFESSRDRMKRTIYGRN